MTGGARVRCSACGLSKCIWTAAGRPTEEQQSACLGSTVIPQSPGVAFAMRNTAAGHFCKSLKTLCNNH